MKIIYKKKYNHFWEGLVWLNANKIDGKIWFGVMDKDIVEINSNIADFRKFSGGKKYTSKIIELSREDSILMEQALVLNDVQTQQSLVLKYGGNPTKIFRSKENFDAFILDMFSVYRDLGVPEDVVINSYYYYQDRECYIVNMVKCILCHMLEEVQDQSKVYALVKGDQTVFRKGDEKITIDVKLGRMAGFSNSIFKPEPVVKIEQLDPKEPVIGSHPEHGDIMIKYLDVANTENSAIKEYYYWDSIGEMTGREGTIDGKLMDNVVQPIVPVKGHWRQLSNDKRTWIKTHMKRKRLAQRFYIKAND